MSRFISNVERQWKGVPFIEDKILIIDFNTSIENAVDFFGKEWKFKIITATLWVELREEQTYNELKTIDRNLTS